MSDKTDELARAIAECQHVDFFNFDPLFKQERFADLQKLAAFWLMRKEIVGVIDNLWAVVGDERIGSHDSEPMAARNLLDKIKELDG